jgi:hypothetical protein
LLLLEDVGADDVVVAGDDGRRGFAIGRCTHLQSEILHQNCL